MFLDSVDAAGREKNHQYIMTIMEEKMKEIGKDTVIQIVTGNASSYKKAGFELEKKYRPSGHHVQPIALTSCSKH